MKVSMFECSGFVGSVLVDFGKMGPKEIVAILLVIAEAQYDDSDCAKNEAYSA